MKRLVADSSLYAQQMAPVWHGPSTDLLSAAQESGGAAGGGGGGGRGALGLRVRDLGVGDAPRARQQGRRLRRC